MQRRVSDERPAKLPPSALLVIWGCPALTLGEAVVWYHDWTLDQGGADGSYISHASLADRLGGKLKTATVSKIRQRLKSLTLHEALHRRDARNLGWVSTLPRQFIPHTYREASGLAVALAGHLRSLAVWRDGPQSPDSLDPRVQTDETPESNLAAAALGGRGEVSSRSSVAESQFSSVVMESKAEKGVGAKAPESKAEERRPPEVVRAEGLALIRLHQGKMLTDYEKELVRAWIARHPDKKATA